MKKSHGKAKNGWKLHSPAKLERRGLAKAGTAARAARAAAGQIGQPCGACAGKHRRHTRKRGCTHYVGGQQTLGFALKPAPRGRAAPKPPAAAAKSAAPPPPAGRTTTVLFEWDMLDPLVKQQIIDTGAAPGSWTQSFSADELGAILGR